MVQEWKQIEELGFDHIWIADHFVNYGNPLQPWFEGWTALSALAALTSTIRIGTLVTSISLRHPAMLARQALTLDHISNGRLNLGIGGGAPSEEGEIVYDMIGLDDWSRVERVTHFEEQIQIIDRLLREEISSFSGKLYQLKDVGMNPRPIQKPRPPFTIGCIGPKMIKIAAKYADTWNTFGGVRLDKEAMYESLKKQSELMTDSLKEIGRDESEVTKALLVYGQDGFEILDSEDNFVRFYEKYSELGFSEFILYYPFKEEQNEVLKKVALETIPALKK